MNTNDETLNGNVEPQNNETSSNRMKEEITNTNDIYTQAIETYLEEQKKKAEQDARQKRFGKKTAKASPKLKAPKKRRIYESGISENVSYGEQVLLIIMSWGASYIPSNAALLPASLEAKNIQGAAYINDVQDAKQARKTDITARQDVYRKLASFARRILNELAASGASLKVLEDAKHYVDKIDGHRIIKVKASDTDQKHISACQTSYVQQVGHFNGLLGVARACPEYDPNVIDLKIVSLEDKRDAMIESNTAFYKTNADYSTAMTIRNEFFNADFTGYVATYGAVKRATKAIYGNSSDQYKQISGFAFKKIRK
ncbi:MAG: hypothetical protein ACSHXF_11940 [Aquaticitalea sp.]